MAGMKGQGDGIFVHGFAQIATISYGFTTGGNLCNLWIIFNF